MLLAQVLRWDDQGVQAHRLGQVIGQPEGSRNDDEERGDLGVSPFHSQNPSLRALFALSAAREYRCAPAGLRRDFWLTLKAVAETRTSRSARLADQFVSAQSSFIELVESLTDEQWRMRGRNAPGLRVNDEDETRPVGVIAHHVASTQPWIMGRIRAIIEDGPTPPVDFKVINAEHAVAHAHATKSEVLAVLRENLRRVAGEVRAIPDRMLDKERQLPSGTMTVQQRLERVLIGHMQAHQASIEATTAD